MPLPGEKTDYPTSVQAAAGNYQKALFLKQQKKYDEAIRYFQKAIDHNPQDINYVVEMAICYLNLNNFSHALNILGPVYSKNSKNTYIIKPYCSALLESGNIEKAKQILQTVEHHFSTDLVLKALWTKASGSKPLTR
jgi:tetratricopeptide (TPR) repeat protein